MTQEPSVTTFVVGDQLPWPEDPRRRIEGPFDAGCDPSLRRAPGMFDPQDLVAGRRRSGVDLAPALGDRVAIELATGQRPPERSRGPAEGARRPFDDPIDVARVAQPTAGQPGAANGGRCRGSKFGAGT